MNMRSSAGPCEKNLEENRSIPIGEIKPALPVPLPGRGGCRLVGAGCLGSPGVSPGRHEREREGSLGHERRAVRPFLRSNGVEGGDAVV